MPSPQCGVSPAPEAAAPPPARCFGALRKPSAGPSDRPAPPPPSPPPETVQLSSPPGPPTVAAPPCRSQTTAEDTSKERCYIVHFKTLYMFFVIDIVHDNNNFKGVSRYCTSIKAGDSQETYPNF